MLTTRTVLSWILSKQLVPCPGAFRQMIKPSFGRAWLGSRVVSIGSIGSVSPLGSVGLLRSLNLVGRPFSSSVHRQAGHSKWQNIKHTKARNDAKRSSQNTKIANMITVAAREGGGPDPATNVRLATMVENALKMSIPKRVIEAAVARASKSAAAGQDSQSITYEGIGPGGVAFVVETLTDNKNRTAQQVRAAFLKFKGNLSPTSFMFQRMGWIQLGEDVDFDAVFETALEAGAQDVVDRQGITVLTEPTDLSRIAEILKQHYKIEDMGLAYEPEPDQAITELDPETEVKLAKLVDLLEDLEDVNTVYTNAI